MKINDFKLERFFAEYEFTVRYNLCSSDCESFTIKEILSLEKGSKEQLNKLWLGYTESQGNRALRNEISKMYSNILPEETMVFAGAEEGIFIFMNALLNEGDHVIVQYPAYQSLFEVANSIGCEVTKWLMDEKNNWELDINFLNKNIKKNTKAIVINSPNNPTGYLMSEKKFREIIDIARKNNLYVFSDEVYRFLEYDKKDRLPSACDLYPKSASLGVMSKTFGLAGLRIGWVCTKDKELLEKMLAFKDFTTICNSAPSEFLATLALKHKEYLISRNLAIIKHNIGLLDAFFEINKSLFDWIRPKAGPIAFAKIILDINSEKFCRDVAKRKGVLLLPSTKYGYGSRHFRIGFGRKNMPDALNRLTEYAKEFL